MRKRADDELAKLYAEAAATATDRIDIPSLQNAAVSDDERILVSATSEAAADGHGGGDDGLMTDAIARPGARRDGIPGSAAEARTSLAASLESHAMAFAAETNRLERRMVELSGL